MIKCFDLGFGCDVKVSQWAQREYEKNKEIKKKKDKEKQMFGKSGLSLVKLYG